jgi:hypothetical protein
MSRLEAFRCLSPKYDRGNGYERGSASRLGTWNRRIRCREWRTGEHSGRLPGEFVEISMKEDFFVLMSSLGFRCCKRKWITYERGMSGLRAFAISVEDCDGKHKRIHNWISDGKLWKSFFFELNEVCFQISINKAPPECFKWSLVTTLTTSPSSLNLH